jgi:tetratricopeptide (TPR) repeat protein
LLYRAQQEENVVSSGSNNRQPAMTRSPRSIRNLQLPRVILTIAAIIAVAWPSHAAYDLSTNRHARIERRLRADTADGQLNQHSLVEAALIAGGTEDRAKLDRLNGRFETLADELNRSLDPTLSARERAEAIHAFLHDRVLGEYRTEASNLSGTLDSGVYNCVSASVLFVALAERCGLTTHAVQLPEHVRCEVMADGIAMPIETTSQNSSANPPGFARKARPRVLTDITLLATLYYNRGVAAFDAGDLETAIDLNAIAVELDPSCRQARDNLLAAINNRVVQLMKSDERTHALRLLDDGLRIAPEYGPFLANRAYLTQKSQ